MQKNVLILCEDNAILSIIAEAVLSKYLAGVDAFSAGYKKAKPIAPEVKKALLKDGSWSESFTHRRLESLQDKKFDLVIIVDPKASKSAQEFDDESVVIEIEYEAPSLSNSTNIERFIKTIKMELIPITRDILEL